MRQPKPYFKKSHKGWYANIGPGKSPVRLASEEEGETLAWEKYHSHMANRQPVNGDCLAGASRRRQTPAGFSCLPSSVYLRVLRGSTSDGFTTEDAGRRGGGKILDE